MCQGETQRAKVLLDGHQRTVCCPQSCLSAVLSCTMSQFSFAATVTQICKQRQRHQTPSFWSWPPLYIMPCLQPARPKGSVRVSAGE